MKTDSQEFERFSLLFNDAVKQTSVAVPRRVLKLFFAHWELLGRWNKKINLTRIIDPKEAMARHYLDSLALLPAIDPARTLLDVGSGAGFPGIVIAIVRPELTVHLVESVGKKAHFLLEARRSLGLDHVTIHNKRVEELPETARWDLVTGRAVADPEKFAEQVRQCVAENGRMALFLIDHPPDNLTGFALDCRHDYRLPFSGEKRTIGVYARSR